MNSYAEHRAEVLAAFAKSVLIADSTTTVVSPSGLYRLETERFETETGWAYSRGRVTRVGDGQGIAEIIRNYGHFWHAWVQHPNGFEYLLCGEDYQGYNVICLETGENQVFFPEAGLSGRGFCWATVHPSPDGLVLAVDGCYWACPYDLVFVDFSQPTKLPLPELARFEDLKNALGWQDNQSFRFEHFNEDETVQALTWQRSMIEPLNITLFDTALEVLALQRVSYQIEADLIGRDDLPPLLESLEDLQQCGETFFGLRIENRLAGAIAYKLEDAVLDIHRVMVHPDFFRRGIAKKLLGFVLEQVGGYEQVIVQTGAANTPAKNMYRAFGFKEVEDVEVVQGLWITRFQK